MQGIFMTKRPDNLLILDIKGAIDSVRIFLKGKTKEDFASDYLLQSAVSYQIQIVGEASNKLSEGYIKKHPKVPWKDIRGMRNILVHAYHGIDTNIVWQTATIGMDEISRLLELD